MSNKNLFKEAIADAKAVREAALANAKAALEEALTPKLQSMLAAKLNEMEELEENVYEDENPEMEEGMYPENTSDEIQDRYRETGAALEEDELEEEFDLSDILAELDEDNSLNEAEDDENENEGEMEELDPKDPKFTEKLKELVLDLIAQEMGSEGEMGGVEEPMNMGDMGGNDESDEDEVPLEEEEINLEELLAELDSLEETDELEEAKKAKAKKMAMAPKKEKEEKKEDEKDMKEALDVINTLRAELNEVNLLNAKLLYVNKIFKAKNLSESQKLQVIASFDKATTAKEAKVVFESLNATLTAAAPKQAIKESLGFASKAAGVAPRKAIVESNDVITRMQKLANIIK